MVKTKCIHIAPIQSSGCKYCKTVGNVTFRKLQCITILNDSLKDILKIDCCEKLSEIVYNGKTILSSNARVA